MLDGLKRRARHLKAELYALYLAYRDPRVPWYARLFAAGVVAYAISPIDLIPDFIPVLGYLDDLILVPLGIVLVLRMIPPEVMADCRERAKEVSREGRRTSWVAAGVIVGIWLLVVTFSVLLVLHFVLR
jgi:uncharacterized membrane protein YkvA (DUF1232 family)